MKLCLRFFPSRLFVNTDITVITVKDVYDLAHLNIALRKKVKNCASFLLAKQWSKVGNSRLGLINNQQLFVSYFFKSANLPY